MDLHAAYAPHVEQALARMAPGEKIGWALTTMRVTSANQQVPVVQLVFWTPSPVVGTMVHCAPLPFVDPFAPLANDAALIDETVSSALGQMRRVAADLLQT